MNQKKLQKQCLPTKRESSSIEEIKKEEKKIYEFRDKRGGTLKLIIKKPASKLAQKMRAMLFKRAASK